MYTLTAHLKPDCQFSITGNQVREEKETNSLSGLIYHKFSSDHPFGISLQDANENIVAVFHSQHDFHSGVAADIARQKEKAAATNSDQ